MRQTETYNLKLIDTDDQFSPDALNENSETLEAELARMDAELSTKATRTEMGTLQTQVDAKAERTELVRVETEAAHIFAGSYTGDGNETQKINLGFTPKAVLVITQYGELDFNGYCHGGLALEGKPLYSSMGLREPAVEIVSGGIEVHYIESGTRVFANESGKTYYFIAFR